MVGKEQGNAARLAHSPFLILLSFLYLCDFHEEFNLGMMVSVYEYHYQYYHTPKLSKQIFEVIGNVYTVSRGNAAMLATVFQRRVLRGFKVQVRSELCCL